MTMIAPMLMSGKVAAKPGHMAGSPAMLAASEGEFAFLVRGLTGGEAEGAQMPAPVQPDAESDGGDALIQDLALAAAADAAPPTVIQLAAAPAIPQDSAPAPQDRGAPKAGAGSMAVSPALADSVIAAPSVPSKRQGLPVSPAQATPPEGRTEAAVMPALPPAQGAEVIAPAPAPSARQTQVATPSSPPSDGTAESAAPTVTPPERAAESAASLTAPPARAAQVSVPPAVSPMQAVEVAVPPAAPSEPGAEPAASLAALVDKFVPVARTQGRPAVATAPQARDGEPSPAEEQAPDTVAAQALPVAAVVTPPMADVRPSPSRARAPGAAARSPASPARIAASVQGLGVQSDARPAPRAPAPVDPAEPAAPQVVAAASQQEPVPAPSPRRAAMPVDASADRAPSVGDRKDVATAREPVATTGTPSARPAVADIVQSLPPIIQSQIGVVSDAMTVARPAGQVGQALAGHVIDMGVGGQWIDRMAREIASLAEGTGHSRFQLSPPNLGRIQIDVWQDAAGGSVQLLTETDEAARRLRDGQAGLQADARLSALSLHHIVIEKSSSGFDSGRDQNGQNPSGQQQAGRDLAGQANGQAGAQGGGQGGTGSGQGKGAADRTVLNGGVAADASNESRAGRAEDGHVRYA